jgi:hypothetical protein
MARQGSAVRSRQGRRSRGSVLDRNHRYPRGGRRRHYSSIEARLLEIAEKLYAYAILRDELAVHGS